MTTLVFKDAVLDKLADRANVAQFVSYGPDLVQRYARIHGHPPNTEFPSPREAVYALLAASPEESVNVRSFTPDSPKSREFVYGLRTSDEVLTNIARMGGQGLYTIINETIDVNDGGVSGVVLGDVMEFAPGDTPRSVEKPGTASLPRELGLRLIEIVYGVRPPLDYPAAERVEFSIHPLRRGVRHGHCVIWELEAVGSAHVQAGIGWPNRFSRLIGDKAFGLLIAELLHLPVPATTVIPRAIAPFTFGSSTGTGEVWIRTCPREQIAGHFTTRRGWIDPFRLLNSEDTDGGVLASVLAQEGVDPVYSGALLSSQRGVPIVEGVPGRGDLFMVGQASPQPLPGDVVQSLRRLYNQAAEVLGPVRFEWVYDGTQPWIVQLHRGPTESEGRTVFPGEPRRFHRIGVAEGLEALRALIANVHGKNEGIIVVGQVGITSHWGDVLRRSRIPSRIEPS